MEHGTYNDKYYLEDIRNIFWYRIDDDMKTHGSYNKILKILLEVCKKRGIAYDENNQELIEKLFTKLNKSYQEKQNKFSALIFDNFDYRLLSTKEKIDSFVQENTSNISADNMDNFQKKFEFVGDQLRQYMTNFFSKNYQEEISLLEREILGENSSLSNEKVKEYLEDTLDLYTINSMYLDFKEKNTTLVELKKQKTLEEIKKDEIYLSEIENILKHDEKNQIYYYHGTQDLETAPKILEEGLLMNSKDIESTAVKEMNLDDLLLYSRGFDGDIGKYAVVIIDRPLGMVIVEKIENKENYNYLQSGLSSFNGRPNYIIQPEYIVGYIDKENHKVIYNSNYKKMVEVNPQNK